MELSQLKELITRTSSDRAERSSMYEQSVRYYQNQNDITNRNNGESKTNENGKDEPLRRADNRVSSNFHQLLVDQEAGYLTTKAPTIDVRNESDTEKVNDVLGDDFSLTLNKLVVDSANAGVGWIHYWIDDDDNFRYATIAPNQVTPIYDTTLNSKLIGILRTYKSLDTDSGRYFTVHEYWDDKKAYFYRTDSSDPTIIYPYTIIKSYDASAGYETGSSNILNHNAGRVPFIAFPKNRYWRPDLLKYKGLIDAYDDIYNGFLNDIDDVQQVILVLRNYGGTDLNSFIDNLKKYKAIKMNSAGGDQAGLDKLTIDIPKDARESALAITRDNIFLQGQGIDPSKFDSTNASGVAIKMLYSHLELKAANTEAHFRQPLNELIRAIMHFLHISDADSRTISQVWTRTKIEDDSARAGMIAQLAPYTSREALARANPLIDDWEQELKDQKKDMQDADSFGVDNE